MIKSKDVVFHEKVKYKVRNTHTSEYGEPNYFGLEDVLGGEVKECGKKQQIEEHGVQPQVEEHIPQDEVPAPHSLIGQRVLNLQVRNALRRSP